MLDISIENVTKVLTTSEKVEKLLEERLNIEEKMDGIKFSLIRNGKKFDPKKFSSNFILAYKSSIIYEEDGAAINLMRAEKDSIGIAQYSLAYNHLKNSHTLLKDLPKNTEFFIEFLAQKPTITRDYVSKHKMILIGYSKCTFEIIGGRLNTNPENMEFENVEEYAKALRIDTPLVLVNGKIFPYESLVNSTTIAALKKIFVNHKEDLIGKRPQEYFENFSNMVLSTESKYGGVIEGVVIEREDGTLLKILQHDQHDKDVRRAKKERWEMTSEREAQYFLKMKNLARFWLDNSYEVESMMIDKHSMKPLTLEERLRNLSFSVYQNLEAIELFPHHDKKNIFQKQEDYHYLLKYLLLKDLKINNNALFFGRIQPPTKMHTAIIRQGIEEFNTVVVAIVKGKKIDTSLNPFSFEIQKEILYEIFRDKIKVIQVSTGNIFTAMQKSGLNINAILCGADRAEGYQEQLKQNPEIRVVKFERDPSGVSGTKLREALRKGDKKAFAENIDEKALKFYDKLKAEICK